MENYLGDREDNVTMSRCIKSSIAIKIRGTKMITVYIKSFIWVVFYVPYKKFKGIKDHSPARIYR